MSKRRRPICRRSRPGCRSGRTGQLVWRRVALCRQPPRRGREQHRFQSNRGEEQVLYRPAIAMAVTDRLHTGHEPAELGVFELGIASAHETGSDACLFFLWVCVSRTRRVAWRNPVSLSHSRLHPPRPRHGAQEPEPARRGHRGRPKQREQVPYPPTRVRPRPLYGKGLFLGSWASA